MTIKTMNIAEFREKGFLQEANRLFFHPLGLALSINIDESGEESLGEIWDYRDDPEGLLFGPGIISKEKTKHVLQLMQGKIEQRTSVLGGPIQLPE